MNNSRYKIILCGACMSGNIGGPALYISFVEELQKHLPMASITVLSKYPEGDAPACKAQGWNIQDMRTSKQLFPGVLIGAVAWILRLVGLPYKWLFQGNFKPYLDGDILVDMSGISFTDHRPGAGVLINSLWFVPAIGSGIPIVKASQAMGPFNLRYIRLASHFFLSKMRLLIARGEQSEQYLKELLPDHDIMQLPDSAFALQPVTDKDVNAILRELNIPEGTAYCILGPSYILNNYTAATGKHLYIDSLVEVARWLLKKSNTHILLLSHESKNSAEDDYFVCNEIYKRLVDTSRVHLVPVLNDPKLAKGICARAEIAIGSRFHFLVATLSSGVPSLAIAWSHKYSEMMKMVGQEDMIIPHENTSSDAALKQMKQLWNERIERRKNINKYTPEVTKKAKDNAVLVAEILRKEIMPSKSEVNFNKGSDVKTLDNVKESGMCIGCGACVAADKSLTLDLSPSSLAFEPSHSGNDAASKVCPAIAVDYTGLIEKRFPGATTGSCGVIKSVVLAQSTNLKRNKKASSGGLIKELLLQLLQSPEIEGVIALAKGEGITYEPCMVTTAEEVDNLPGSIYHCVSFEKAYELLSQVKKKVVVVALPCQLEGMFSYIYGCQPELLDKIHTTVGLVCGWQYSQHAVKALCDYSRLPYSDLQDISYRGGDSVGKMVLSFTDGNRSINRKNNLLYLAAFDRSYNLHRCHLCVNHVNYLADIVVGDAWLKKTNKTRSGVSLVITRNEHAKNLLNELVEKNMIVTAEGSELDIVESQSRNLVFGDYAYSYANFLKHTGKYVPDLNAPNKSKTLPLPQNTIECFAKNLTTKRKLQVSGKYKSLLIRKLAYDFPALMVRTVVRKLKQKIAGKKMISDDISFVPSVFK